MQKETETQFEIGDGPSTKRRKKNLKRRPKIGGQKKGLCSYEKKKKGTEKGAGSWRRVKKRLLKSTRE